MTENRDHVQQFASPADVAAAAHDIIVGAAAQAIAERGRFAIALSGGSTPRALYQALAADATIDWSKWWLLWGDERTVPPDHAESNYLMVREALLNHISTRPGLVLSPVAGEFALLPAEEQAQAYEAALREQFGVDLPQIDLSLLGMGADGHTASLFPFTFALRERERLFVANDVAKLNTTRLTMTLPLIEASRQILFLVCGADKAPALHEVLYGKYDPTRYPSQFLRDLPQVTWLVDEGAVSRKP